MFATIVSRLTVKLRLSGKPMKVKDKVRTISENPKIVGPTY